MKQFSRSASIFAGIGHFIITIFLSCAGFGAAMSGFDPSGRAGHSADGLAAISWFWCPLPMAAAKYWGITVEHGQLLLFPVWSALVGIGVGFLVPVLRADKK